MSYSHYYENPRRFPAGRRAFAPPLELDAAWQLDGIRFPPKLADGMLFVRAGETLVRARDEASGALVWEFQLPAPASEVSRADLLLSGDGLLTVQNDEVFVLDIRNGALRNRASIGYPELRPAVFDRNALFCFTFDEELNASCVRIDIEGGAAAWSYPVGSAPSFITLAEERILFPDESQIVCLSAKDGALLWSAPGAGFEGPLIAYQDTVVATIEPGTIAALELDSGEMRWKQKISQQGSFILTGYADSLIVLGREACSRISARTGRVESVANVEKQFRSRGILFPSAATAAEKHLFFADVHQRLVVALDLDSGNVVWSHQCREKVPVYNAPVIGSRMYVVDRAGSLYAFRQT